MHHDIPLIHRGGRHGHLGLIMPVAEYMVVTGITFHLPVYPGQILVHAGGTNAVTRQETICLCPMPGVVALNFSEDEMV